MRIVPILLAVVTASASVGAQTVGDLYVVDTQQQAVYLAPRGGNSATLVGLGPGVPTAITNGPGDGSALAVVSLPTALIRTQILRLDASTVTVVSSLVNNFAFVPDIQFDDAGDVLLLNAIGVGPPGIYRMPLVASPTPTLVTAFTPRNQPVAMGEDVETGERWVLDAAGVVHRLDLSGGAVLSITKTGASSLRGGGVAVDPVSGHPLLAVGNLVLRYDPSTNTLTTVVSLGFPQGGAEADGIHFDPLTRLFLFAGWQGFGPGMFGAVREIDLTGQVLRTTSLGSPTRPVRVASAWGRSFTPSGPPTAGAAYSLRLQSRADAGRTYQVGVSFGSRPGIPSPIGQIPLRLDPLLLLSLSGSPLFQGFAGTLSASGNATIGISIPGGTRGVRVIAAAVTFDAQGLSRILGPFGFTIR